MPKGIVEEASDFVLEEDTPYRAQLLEVVEKTTPGGTSAKTGKTYEAFSKWIWKFEVTEGEKLGQWTWAETEDKLTTAEGSRVRIFAEALRGKPYQLGEGFDTDDLIGMECYIEVGHEVWTKSDGSNGYRCPVINAFALVDTDPQAQLDPWATPQDSEPPF